ncbi:MAG: pentapeptide repeat-containing protein, partial [Moorea sp. SIO3C2]|nr:pentapeptide repeat-containing protein [Moorena sp. SIO3C2]
MGANFSSVTAHHVDFGEANLGRSNLQGADLSNGYMAR